VITDTDLESVMARARDESVKLLIVDSIQTVQLAAVGTAAGAITQLKECTAALVRFAKGSGTSVVIVGHVTKDGAIAGPRVLEHLVDTVLYFESDASSRFRNVRATKNRFGSVGELAFFHILQRYFSRVRVRLLPAASSRSLATGAGRCWWSFRRWWIVCGLVHHAAWLKDSMPSA
jgi:DNA repair protein RadA/Sms